MSKDSQCPLLEPLLGPLHHILVDYITKHLFDIAIVKFVLWAGFSTCLLCLYYVNLRVEYCLYSILSLLFSVY